MQTTLNLFNAITGERSYTENENCQRIYQDQFGSWWVQLSEEEELSIPSHRIHSVARTPVPRATSKSSAAADSSRGAGR